LSLAANNPLSCPVPAELLVLVHAPLLVLGIRFSGFGGGMGLLLRVLLLVATCCSVILKNICTMFSLGNGNQIKIKLKTDLYNLKTNK